MYIRLSGRGLFSLLSAAVLLVFIMFFLSCGSVQDQTSNNENDSIGENQKRNVILIIIDTLRADHLSCYGYFRNTSPSIDSLAASGTLWQNAYAQSPWTLPSHATIWTGLSVRSHGTVGFFRLENDEGIRNYALDPSLPSLPVLFGQAGYRTCGIVNVTLLRDEYNFDIGFDHYSCNLAGHGQAGASVDSLISWVVSDSINLKPFFCILHLYDVHTPYNPPDDFDLMFTEYGSMGITAWFDEETGNWDPGKSDHLLKLYDGEIAWVDYNLGRLFEWLRNDSLAENTLVVITSDHGEEFLDHGGIDHGHTLYQELIHIPLIMSGPGIEPGVVSPIPVGQYDILPTLLAWAGIENMPMVDGSDILSGDISYSRSIPGSGVCPRSWDSFAPHQASVVTGSIKTIILGELESFITYDLVDDPIETRPQETDSMHMEKVLFYWASPQLGLPEPVFPDYESLDVLRDLGYIK